KVNLLEVAGLREVFLAFDMHNQESPYVSAKPNPFLDQRVRQAILQAIDTRKLINEVLNGFADPASQFGPPNVFGYDSTLNHPAYNLENARKLMKEAGFEQGFSVTLDAPENVYFRDSLVADRVAQSLRDIQIQVKVNKLEKAKLFDKETSHDTSFYMLSWSS